MRQDRWTGHSNHSGYVIVTVALLLVVLIGFSAVWLVANPLGRFGWCCYGYTTYGAWPRPISDLQVRADGSTRHDRPLSFLPTYSASFFFASPSHTTVSFGSSARSLATPSAVMPGL